MKIWWSHFILFILILGYSNSGYSIIAPCSAETILNGKTEKELLSCKRILLNASSAVTDASVSSVSRIEYTQIPFDQAIGLISGAMITNAGTGAITNVSLKINVCNLDGTIYKSFTSSSVSSLSGGNSASFSINDIKIEETGNYILKSFPVMDQTDENSLNDTLVYTIAITDSTYSRDNGYSSDVIGIGAGTGGYIGQQFTIKSETNLISISGYLFGDVNYEKKKLAFALWNQSNGKPDTMIGTTDTIIYGSNYPGDYTIRMSGGAIKLIPGTYIVTAIELDTMLTLGLSSDIVTKGTSWIDWPGNSYGWTNLESFGAPHAKTPMIRMNLTACTEPELTVNVTDATCSSCSNGSLTVTNKSLATYYYLWSNGLRTTENSNLKPGVYALVVRDNLGCTYGYNHTVSYTTGIEELTEHTLQLYPNPGTGHFFVNFNTPITENANLKILNPAGKLIYQTSIEKGTANLEVNLPKSPNGVYVLLISGNSWRISRPLLIQGNAD